MYVLDPCGPHWGNYRDISDTGNGAGELSVPCMCVLFYFDLFYGCYEEQNPDEMETSFSFHRREAFPCLAWNLLAGL